MSENNKNVDFNDEKEPIDSIEQTVEDLKKKIAELSEEKELEAENNNEAADERMQKIQEIKDATVNTLKNSISDIKEKAQNVSANPDVQKTIAYIKENAVKAVDLAKIKIDEISNDPKVKEYADKAKESVKNASETASKYVDEHLDEKTKENLFNAYDSASKKVAEGTKKIVTAADEFLNKPEVQDTLEKAKKGANDIVEKGSEALKNLFKN